MQPLGTLILQDTHPQIIDPTFIWNSGRSQEQGASCQGNHGSAEGQNMSSGISDQARKTCNENRKLRIREVDVRLDSSKEKYENEGQRQGTTCDI
jgi:hypothetical protein